MYKIKNFLKELFKNPYEKMQEQIENDTEYVKDEVVTARVIGRECNHMSYPARNDTYITYFLVNNKKYKCGNIQTYNYCKDKEYVNVIFRTRKFKNNVVKHAVIRVYFD